MGQFSSKVESSAIIPAEDQATIIELLESNLDKVTQTEQFEVYLETASSEVVEELTQIQGDAVVTGFRYAILAGGITAILGAVLSILLPKRKLEGDAVEEAVRAKVIPKLDFEMTDIPRNPPADSG